MKKIVFLFALPVFVFSFQAMAQSAPQSGIAGFISSHGGLAASVLLFVFSANIVLSAVRDLLAKWDGVDPSQPIPAQFSGLSKVESVCVVLGKIIDYIQGNIQH